MEFRVRVLSLSVNCLGFGFSAKVSMWAGDTTYDVGGKGFDPTVGKITAPGGRTFFLVAFCGGSTW